MTNNELSSFSDPPSLTGEEIRQAFLDFFASRNHKIIKSASLIPEDPTVLLTIAGMLPFKPVFLGLQNPPAPRATSSQKCIRTNDIDNVGRTARHHTFFEMLGNFSFGDYFKKEAIEWAWELTIEVFKLNPKNIVISVFREDEEAEKIWRDVIGVAPERIVRMGTEDNFWSSGPTGPCGPCSELYFDFTPELGHLDIDLEDDSRFIEFYNLVFMQFNRDASGKLTPLANCNIDTGMGLERMAQILQKKSNNYETDLIFPLIQEAASLANLTYESTNQTNQSSLKIIGDHSRAVTHLISDGVTASNLGRGYILRRLIRRMIRHGRLIGIQDSFLPNLAELAIQLMGKGFPELHENKDLIVNELKIEESRFLETLERGEKLLDDLISQGSKEITGEKAFELYDTYGFPLELTEEIAAENHISVDLEGFEVEMAKQRKRAKAASVSIDLTLKGSLEREIASFKPTFFVGYEELQCSASVLAIFIDSESVDSASSGQNIQIVLDQTPFYGESGGQIGDKGFIFTESLEILVTNVIRKNKVFIHVGIVEKGVLKVDDSITAKVDQPCRLRAQSNHTATHLLQSALKLVVDPSVAQRGSLVAFDKLRFDFNSPSVINSAQLQQMEKLINTWISEDHQIELKTLPINEALEAGALAMFGEKYGDFVRVVDIPGLSMELCGGTHVDSTSQLGAFKIINEIGIASGIRRIEAVSGPAVLDYLNERDVVVTQLTQCFKAQPHEIVDRVYSLQNELKETVKELEKIQQELALAKAMALISESISINSCDLLIQRLDGVEGNAMQTAAATLMDRLGDNSAVILGGIPDQKIGNKLIFVAAFGSKLLSKGLHAGQFISQIAKICGGGGGGRPNLAQAGGRNPESLDNALQFALDQLTAVLD